jgi:hypothetical protein
MTTLFSERLVFRAGGMSGCTCLGTLADGIEAELYRDLRTPGTGWLGAAA